MKTLSLRPAAGCLAMAALLSTIPWVWSQEVAPAPPAAVADEVPAPAASAGVAEVAAAEQQPPAPAGKIILNFRNAPVDAVLDHLSQAAGFVIVKDVPVSGTVDVWSHQPLSADEAVELLNTVLARQGLATVQSGRTLKIVSRTAALAADLPVESGADPELIARSDTMATQIIPVKHADAAKLVENLKPLLGEGSQLSANASSNSLILTDTKTNIRRMVRIVQALDTSISNITEIRVFPLEYAEAENLATVVNKVFEKPDQNQSSNRNSPMQFFQRMRGGPGGPMGGGSDQTDSGASEAKTATATVTAVGDERSNCLVVSASEEVMPQITALVKQVDVPTQDDAVVDVFTLRYADAEDVADILKNIYADSTSTSTQNIPGQRQFGMFGRMMGGMPGGGPTTSQGSSGSRSLGQADVTVVADTRTNSVVVNASPTTQATVAKVIEKLDATPKNVTQVYIYRIENADLENLQTILEGMFDDIESTGTTTTLAPTGGARSNTSTTSGNTNRN